MDQGKRQSQMKDSGTFALMGLILMGLILLLLCLASCGTRAQTPEEEKVYININGENVELVADEYDNQYLKEFIGNGGYIYIPYVGPTDDGSDTLKFYNTKN